MGSGQDVPTFFKGMEHISKILGPASKASIPDIIAMVIIGIVASIYLSRGIFWDKPDPYSYTLFERPQQQEGAGNAKAMSDAQKRDERNIAKKMTEAGKTLVIFWGSQSGTAERLATQLAKECQLRFGVGTICADLSDYDPESISDLSSNHIAIFILSTYGEGDPSDNATGLWDWMQSTTATPTSSSDTGPRLANLRYGAFGLGNSNYKNYNRVIDVTVDFLDNSGAKSFITVGKADDAERSTEEDFLSWKDSLFSAFRTDFQYIEKAVEFQPTIAVIEDESLEPIDLHHGEPTHPADNNKKGAAACSRIQTLGIKNARELFISTDRHCVHMELDLSEFPEMNYKTGDHLALWPSSPNNEVELLIRSLGLQNKLDTPLLLRSLDPSNIKIELPSPTTIRALFTRYLEIGAPVSRSTIEGLAQFAPNPEAKAFILKLGQDKLEYSTYLTHTHVTLGRLLILAGNATSSWSKLPLEFVIESLPRMQPRYYSISSSSVLNPRRVAITALVAADPLPKNPHAAINGVASNYLLALMKAQVLSHSPAVTNTGIIAPEYDLAGPSDSLLQGQKLYAHIRRSKFRLPTQSTCPIIMIAAGTGIAPFRAFIAERAKLHNVGKPVGQMLLFFGCRRSEEDFIYQNELLQTQKGLDNGKESLFKIMTAFSREQNGQKVYVQQRVKEYGAEVVRLMEEEGANLYICGRATMAREVSGTLGEFLIQTRGWNDSQAQNWTQDFRKRGKWREDVWG
ncbi:uncharacterized protein TRUGW13939_09304 [Talaromyces rugulosus]|uniref:NADPH--hemoprotein reductase n=1 Tax=Talaromyces rugulosus TaxID=121627 RepID=A0A7H8R7L9_TALRU|nr:uncharacterized protein TRUGW13939_09304 [Talaromyces rugulosus]QKX62147.1 hypothetical protein TRUGW13939_09304 [Talaromyces rugulosus]